MHECPHCQSDCDFDAYYCDACEESDRAWDEEDYDEDADYWYGSDDTFALEIPYAACVTGYEGLWLKLKDCIHGHVHGITFNRLVWSPWPSFFDSVHEAETSHFNRPWCNVWMIVSHDHYDDVPF